MVCRLARRTREAPPESLHVETRSPAPSREDAAGQRRRSKKSPGLASTKALCKAWGEAQPNRSHNRYVAKELADAAGNLPIQDLDASVPNALIAAWKSRYKITTAHARRYALHHLLRWLDKEARTDLAAQLTRLRRPASRTIIATPAELAALFAHAVPWIRCWLYFTANLGMRFSEAQGLTMRGYNREAQTVTFKTKGSQKHTLPVFKELAALFDQVPKGDDEAPILERLYGRKLSATSIRDAWHALKKVSGVSDELHPHDLRRTVATAIYNQTKNLLAVQQLLGHSNLASTLHYLAPHNPDELRPIINRFVRQQTEKIQ